MGVVLATKYGCFSALTQLTRIRLNCFLICCIRHQLYRQNLVQHSQTHSRIQQPGKHLFTVWGLGPERVLKLHCIDSGAPKNINNLLHGFWAYKECKNSTVWILKPQRMFFFLTSIIQGIPNYF